MYFKWKESDVRTEEQKEVNAKKEDTQVNVNKCQVYETVLMYNGKICVLRFLYYVETM